VHALGDTYLDKGTMRPNNWSFLFSLVVLAACSADHALAPEPEPRAPHVSASRFLGGTGTTALYWSRGIAINDSGVAVGEAQTSVSERRRAAFWSPPDYQVSLLPDLGAASSIATSIAIDGTISGEICDGTELQPPCHPVYWRNGTLHQLGGMGGVNDVCPCDGHTLVGQTIVNFHSHGAIWVDDLLIDIGTPNGVEDAELTAVSHGYIVGYSWEYHGPLRINFHSYRWSPAAGWVALGPESIDVIDVNAEGSALARPNILWPNGSNTSTTIPGAGDAAAINDSGVVAGECVPNPNESTTRLICEYSSSTGWTVIGTETLSTVLGINNANAAVGQAADGERLSAIIWTP
jgi:hypothetical protein